MNLKNLKVKGVPIEIISSRQSKNKASTRKKIVISYMFSYKGCRRTERTFTSSVKDFLKTKTTKHKSSC